MNGYVLSFEPWKLYEYCEWFITLIPLIFLWKISGVMRYEVSDSEIISNFYNNSKNATKCLLVLY